MTSVSHKPIQGEVVSGPGRYRSVPLDRVLITERDGQIVMAGMETRIEVRAPSIQVCADAFLNAFYVFAARVGEGDRPSFVRGDDEFTELQRVVGKRLMDVISAVPADGEPVEIHSQFYEGLCPQEVNPRRTTMGGPVPF